MNRSPRAGFSFVEALVVLAITSVLLVLLAAVATGATRAGFRAAGRADAAADRLVGAEALRALLRGVRPPAQGRDAAFQGEADGFTAVVASGRPTACGPGAPRRAAVRLDRAAGRARLLCVGDDGRPAVLLDLGPAPAAFAYALAGRPWSDRVALEPPAPRPGAAASPRRRLWIRLASAAGPELVEAVDPSLAGAAP